jgi:hypothetical protein
VREGDHLEDPGIDRKMDLGEVGFGGTGVVQFA